jgi:hypothetical protein
MRCKSEEEKKFKKIEHQTILEVRKELINKYELIFCIKVNDLISNQRTGASSFNFNPAAFANIGAKLNRFQVLQAAPPPLARRSALTRQLTAPAVAQASWTAGAEGIIRNITALLVTEVSFWCVLYKGYHSCPLVK